MKYFRRPMEGNPSTFTRRHVFDDIRRQSTRSDRFDSWWCSYQWTHERRAWQHSILLKWRISRMKDTTLWRGRCSPQVVQNVTGPWTSPVNKGEERASMWRLPGDVWESTGRKKRLSLTVKHGGTTSVWVLRSQPRVTEIGARIHKRFLLSSWNYSCARICILLRFVW